jgi:hypothetical protein
MIASSLNDEKLQTNSQSIQSTLNGVHSLKSSLISIIVEMSEKIKL